MPYVSNTVSTLVTFLWVKADSRGAVASFSMIVLWVKADSRGAVASFSMIVLWVKVASGGAVFLSLFEARALCRRAERDGKMADGVDHIDIYADVEEEFNQVLNLQWWSIWSSVLFFFISALLLAVIVMGELNVGMLKQASCAYRPPSHHAASPQPRPALSAYNCQLVFSSRLTWCIICCSLCVICAVQRT